MRADFGILGARTSVPIKRLLCKTIDCMADRRRRWFRPSTQTLL